MFVPKGKSTLESNVFHVRADNNGFMELAVLVLMEVSILVLLVQALKIINVLQLQMLFGVTINAFADQDLLKLVFNVSAMVLKLEHSVIDALTNPIQDGLIKLENANATLDTLTSIISVFLTIKLLETKIPLSVVLDLTSTMLIKCVWPAQKDA